MSTKQVEILIDIVKCSQLINVLVSAEDVT